MKQLCHSGFWFCGLKIVLLIGVEILFRQTADSLCWKYKNVCVSIECLNKLEIIAQSVTKTGRCSHMFLF